MPTFQMEHVFAMKVQNSGKFLTVPDCHEQAVTLTDQDPDEDLESTSQMWIKDEHGCIKWAERPLQYLVIEGGILRLSSDLKQPWEFKNSRLVLKHDPDTCLVQDGQHVKQHSLGKKELLWDFVTVHLPRPATSCHLRYGPELPDWLPSESQWILECSVIVRNSYDCTYFMVTGWGPGGYCGIQQLPNNERKAIFSMWNEKTYSVEAVEVGPGVEASKFGGEGTGIKTMLSVDWQEDNLITFKVKAYLIDNYWFTECHFSLHENGPFRLMAVLKRSAKGGPILSRQGFYSFIEDFNRCKTAKGWKKLRKAEFLRPRLTRPSDGLKVDLSEAKFTKVETGSDAFAADFAKAFPCKQGFVMQTGIEDCCPNNTMLHSL